MIAKGNQRGGGQNLATHLLNSLSNEEIQVMEITGAVAQDLHGAMAEWWATSKGTFCKKYLYSLSINLDPTQGKLSSEQYMDFITRTEQALGLTDQPRAIVVHHKDGREHCHVVWSRIKIEEMKAVQISFDHIALGRVCREFARDHGLSLPEGMQNENFDEHTKEDDKWSDKAQEERTGISRAERMEVIGKAWQQSDTGKAFVHALAHAGYILACGSKKNTYVVVDRHGEVHGLSRQVKGVKKKEIHGKLENYPLEKLPDIERAKKLVANQENERRGRLSEEFQKAADKRHLALQQKQVARRETLIKKKQQQEIRQREALQTLIQQQQA